MFCISIFTIAEDSEGASSHVKACASDANSFNLDASSQPTASSEIMKFGTHLVADLLYLFTLLNAFMNQSPSLKANSPLGSQEIPRILWKPKVRSHISKSSSPFPILSQMNPVRILFLDDTILYYPLIHA